jgi:hypothetical protein
MVLIYIYIHILYMCVCMYVYTHIKISGHALWRETIFIANCTSKETKFLQRQQNETKKDI